MTNKTNIDMLTKEDVMGIKYHPYDNSEMWKLNLLEEIMGIKYGDIETPDILNMEDVDTILNWICTCE